MRYILLLLSLVSSLAFGGVNIPSYGGAPYFQAYLNGAQSVTSNTQTVVNLDTVVFDSGSYFSVSTHRYTPLVAGKYQVSVCLQGSQVATTGTQAYGAYIMKNGVQAFASAFSATSTSFGLNSQQCQTAMLAMNGSTDYMTMAGIVTGTTTAFSTGAGITWMQAFYIGP